MHERLPHLLHPKRMDTSQKPSAPPLGKPLFVDRLDAGLAKVMRLNWDLLALVCLLILINLPYLSNEFLPAHDTLQTFQGFHYFYSHFYQYREIPHWNLYGNYGGPSGFWQLVFLTPSSYLCIFLGRLFGIVSVLPLWKISIILDQLVLLIGIYKLSCLLYKRRAVIFFVSAGVVCSTVWPYQIWWNLRIYYLIPLMLYFLFAFFIRKKPQFFWFAGITAIIALIGNLFYFAVVWSLVFGVMALVLLREPWQAWRFSVHSWWHGQKTLGLLREPWQAWRALLSCSVANLVPGLVFIVLAGCYVIFLKYSTETFAFGGQRDPQTGMVSLTTFLTHGGRVDVLTLIRMFFFGYPISTPWSGAPDTTVYIGLLPLPFAFFALLRNRDVRFLALAAGGFFLLSFSVAGVVAIVLYYVPLVATFRHLGLLCGLMKIFILLWAGFGLEAFVGLEAWLSRGSWKHVLYASLAILLLGDLFFDKNLYPLAAPLKGLSSPEDLWVWMRWVGRPTVFLVRIFAYSLCILIARKQVGRQVLLGGLVLCYLLDMLLFQSVIAYTTRRLPAESQAELAVAMTVGHVPVSLQRVLKLDQLRALPAENVFIAAYVEQDACFLGQGNYLYPKGLQLLLRARMLRTRMLRARQSSQPGLAIHPLSQNTFMQGGPSLLRVMGCLSPKLRLMSSPIVTPSLEEAERVIAASAALENVLILRGESSQNPPSTPVPEEIIAPGQERQSAPSQNPPSTPIPEEEIKAFYQERQSARRLHQRGGGIIASDQERQSAPSQNPPSTPVPEEETPNRTLGTVQLVRGNANEIAVKTFVSVEGAWLVYADAFHPDWRAKVNGQDTPIAEAYLAFKAVPIPQGESTVDLRFNGGWKWRIADVWLIIGIIFSGYIVILYLKELCRHSSA